MYIHFGRYIEVATQNSKNSYYSPCQVDLLLSYQFPNTLTHRSCSSLHILFTNPQY